MKLYNYFRSSAAYRVRIALNLKALPWTHVGVHLLKGEQRSPEYLAMNPAGLVPVLTDGEQALAQSLAIMEYLDESRPETHRLLPGDALQRAQIRAASLSLACDVHPMCNVRVLNYLTNEFKVTQAEREAWFVHWVVTGLDAFEASLAKRPARGDFCFGDTPTMADCVLVPQVFSAKRFNVDIEKYPLIVEIDARCNALDAFQQAHPIKQPDFQP
jgi:maleylpyruvate isomerase